MIHPDRDTLNNAALADLISDAKNAEHQANNGPFYPDRGITADSLRAYAAKCRAQIAACASGDAHVSVLKGHAR